MARVGEQSAAPLRSSVPVRVWRSVRSASVREPTMSLGLAILAVLVLISLVGPVLSSTDPSKINMDARLQAPSATHWVRGRRVRQGRLQPHYPRRAHIPVRRSDRRAVHHAARSGLRLYRGLLPTCGRRSHAHHGRPHGHSNRPAGHRAHRDTGCKSSKRHHRHSGGRYPAHDPRRASLSPKPARAAIRGRRPRHRSSEQPHPDSPRHTQPARSPHRHGHIRRRREPCSPRHISASSAQVYPPTKSQAGAT